MATEQDRGGGMKLGPGMKVVMTDSSVSGNCGPGISAAMGTHVEMTRSQVEQNIGGGIVATQSSFAHGNAAALSPVAPLAAPGHSSKLLPPENITPAWLWQHAPIRLWLKAIGLVLAAFSAGVLVGQSALYREVVRKLSPTSAQLNVPQSTPAASSP